MVLKPNKPDRKEVDGTNIQVGMPILDKHGNYIGVVKEIQDKGFLVDRSATQYEDIFVPYWVCMQNGPEEIKLEIGQNEVNPNVWRTPDHTE